MLFDAKDDGFANFHKKVDKKGPTLIFFKTRNNYSFGSYSPVSWNNLDKGIPDKNLERFLFSLSHKTKHPLTKNPE